MPRCICSSLHTQMLVMSHRLPAVTVLWMLARSCTLSNALYVQGVCDVDHSVMMLKHLSHVLFIQSE